MADFINTVDVLGEDITINRIIERLITEFKDDTVEIVGTGAFSGCEVLKNIELPKVTEIGSEAFIHCKVLESVYFPLAKTSGSQAFRSCVNLKSVKFPVATELAYLSFEACPNIETVYAPLATRIRQWCGLGGKVKKLDLPSLQEIQTGGLVGDKLETLILRYNGVCALGNTNNLASFNNGKGYIYVPRVLVNSYKAATNWSTVADRFRAIEDYSVDGTITGEFDTTKI